MVGRSLKSFTMNPLPRMPIRKSFRFGRGGWILKSIPIETPPGLFLRRMTCLVRQHPVPRPPAPFALLSPDLFSARPLLSYEPLLFRFDLIQQKTPRKKPVKALLSCCLAFDLKAGGTMKQHHARRGFIDILSAVTAGPHERFLDIYFPDTQRRHPLG